jgi:hypothetical protein
MLSELDDLTVGRQHGAGPAGISEKADRLAPANADRRLELAQGLHGLIHIVWHRTCRDPPGAALTGMVKNNSTYLSCKPFHVVFRATSSDEGGDNAD